MRILLTLTLCGSLLTLLLLLLKKCLGMKFSSTVYYYAWLLVLLRFLIPMPGLLPLNEKSASAPETVRTVPYDIPELSYGVSSSGSIQDKGTGYSSRMEASTETEKAGSQAHATKQVQINWKSPEIWLTIWAAGALLNLILYSTAYLRFTGRIRRELKLPSEEDLRIYARFRVRKPNLYRCSSVRTPLMVGVLHPMIILPEADYDEEKLDNILRHELMHYRRRDVLYKWFAVLVYAAQWFNPLCYVVRGEISRACELSCDEMLLRGMDREQKQSYGNTLLSMAASASLPAGVVATTFATEKKTLKERLDQIMNSKMTKSRVIASLLAFVLLAGCALFTGPKSLADNEAAEMKTVEVSTVDEFVSAIAPNTEIVLKEGTYDLKSAASYGGSSDSQYWRWEEQYDGPQLVIEDVNDLVIRGTGAETTVIAAEPRYANVLSFIRCRNITLKGFTAGHTQEPGYCAGGVICFMNTQNVIVDGCGLYGCGTIGIDAQDCRDISVTNTSIYDCSQGAVYLNGCRNVTFDGCEIRNHSSATEPSVGWLFWLDRSDNVRIVNSDIHDNFAQVMLTTGYSRDVVFAGNRVADNAFLSAVFNSAKYSPVVEGCTFENNSIFTWYSGNGIFAVDAEGNTLGKDDLQAMNRRTIGTDESLLANVRPADASALVAPSEDGAYHVSTMDEFLSAIGSERTIVLDEEFYDLTAASDYGTPGGENYFWKESYDGPELVISNVHDLTIQGAAAEGENTAKYHLVSAEPRYANVLSFQYCDNITLMNFTAGHTKEQGECCGGVFFFQNCSDIHVLSCRMYGCGILGIEAWNCYTLTVDSCEIYECSQGAVSLAQTDGARFSNMNIHDVPSPSVRFFESGDKTWNGNPIPGDVDAFDVDENGELVEYDWQEYYYEYAEPEIDYNMALLVARGELRRLQDLGIISREVAFDGELEYAAYADEYATEERAFKPSFYARDYSGKYMINFRIDNTGTGDVRSLIIEANHDEDDEPIPDMEIEIGGEIWKYYNNFDDIFPADLTVGALCDKLAQYWGYSGWTLADVYSDEYQMQMNAPAEDLLVSELPEDNYYATVYFDGDDEGAPMFIQICHFPGRVMFLFGDGHLHG